MDHRENSDLPLPFHDIALNMPDNCAVPPMPGFSAELLEGSRSSSGSPEANGLS